MTLRFVKAGWRPDLQVAGSAEERRQELIRNVPRMTGRPPRAAVRVFTPADADRPEQALRCALPVHRPCSRQRILYGRAAARRRTSAAKAMDGRERPPRMDHGPPRKADARSPNSSRSRMLYPAGSPWTSTNAAGSAAADRRRCAGPPPDRPSASNRKDLYLAQVEGSHGRRTIVPIAHKVYF